MCSWTFGSQHSVLWGMSQSSPRDQVFPLRTLVASSPPSVGSGPWRRDLAPSGVWPWGCWMLWAVTPSWIIFPTSLSLTLYARVLSGWPQRLLFPLFFPIPSSFCPTFWAITQTLSFSFAHLLIYLENASFHFQEQLLPLDYSFSHKILFFFWPCRHKAFLPSPGVVIQRFLSFSSALGLVPPGQISVSRSQGPVTLSWAVTWNMRQWRAGSCVCGRGEFVLIDGGREVLFVGKCKFPQARESSRPWVTGFYSWDQYCPEC